LIYKVKWADKARNQLRNLDKTVQKNILKYLNKRIINAQNPKQFGKSLSKEKYGLWRYRMANYRIICQFGDEEAEECIVLVVAVGHRKDVYQSFAI
jgi:mRNA interferase RelE/StbE